MSTARLELQRLIPGHAPTEDACTASLAAAVGEARGVRAARFRSEGGRAALHVDYDPSVVPHAELVALAEDAGRRVGARFVHRELLLGGLHCTACAEKVASVAQRLEGVVEAQANYATEKLHVALDTSVAEQAATLSRVVTEVEGLGYRVVPAGALEEGSAGPGTEALPRPGLLDALGLHRLPADLRLSFLAGAALLAGFLLQNAGAPTAAWLPAYLAAYLAGGWHATRHAVRAAAKARFDIDLLMVVAALGAASLGAWAEGALLLFLFSLGHALEHLAMDRARGAIRALAGLSPKTANVRRDGVELTLSPAELLLGDTVIVRPGERVPADGEVTGGESHVDQAPITGESIPVAKRVGDDVYAGTINGAGWLEVVTRRPPEDTVLSRVIRAVESAQAAKAPSHRSTERFQRVFSPIVLGATLLLIAVPPLFGVPFGTSFMRAMVLLVASSPCALALATPSAVLAGVARGARSGVLIKGGAHLENAGMADAVALDKTGTLTEGRPTLTDVWADDELLALAVTLESRSAHPLAAAVVRGAAERGYARGAGGGPVRGAADGGALPGPLEVFEERSGRGVVGTTGGLDVLVGNRRLLGEAGIEVPAAVEARARELEEDGKTTVFVAARTSVIVAARTSAAVGRGGAWGAAPSAAQAGVAGGPQGATPGGTRASVEGEARAAPAGAARGALARVGVLAVRDEPRPEARRAIAELRRLGVKRIVMLTGDNERVAAAVARELGVDELHAGLMPDDKARIVGELRRLYKRVVMVGDGVNDAPAMVAADVSVAMGGAGSDVALEAADIALMADDLDKLPYAIALSRASRRMIVQNLLVSLGVIALLVPSALLGWAGIGVAVVIHESSTLVVVANALRLLGFKGRQGGRAPAAA